MSLVHSQYYCLYLGEVTENGLIDILTIMKYKLKYQLFKYILEHHDSKHYNTMIINMTIMIVLI